MCLLTFFPDGEIPNAEAIAGLINGAKYNSDGHGYAMISEPGIKGERHIISYKGLDAEKVLDRFLIDRDQHSSGPALFHSRIGTDGWNDEENCHPFQIGKDERTVLAHNGILPTMARPVEKHDSRSDTRILASELLAEKPFGYFHSRLARAAFESWLGSYNKIVILTTNPRYPTNAMIFNQREGTWEHGAWWSNDSYLPFYGKKVTSYHYVGPTTTVLGRLAVNDEESPLNQDCPKCEEKDAVDRDYRVCWTCGTCADCLGNWTLGECLCYIQSRGGLNICQECKDTKSRCKCDDE